MPIRKITKSNRSISGYFNSRKNKRMVAFESGLEHDFFLLLEFDPSVLSFEEQPFKLQYECEGSKHYYTPDVLVHYADFSSIYEVKYQAIIDKDEELQRKLHCIEHHFKEENKYSFNLFTDQTVSTIYLQNLKFLYKPQFMTKSESMYTKFLNTYEALTVPISLNEFLMMIDEDFTNHAKLLPYLWNFIYYNPTVINLGEKLSINSLLQVEN